MEYIYGSFTKRQIKEAAHAMHNDVHKLLLYKDNRIEEKIFENDEAFLIFSRMSCLNLVEQRLYLITMELWSH